MVGTYNPVDKNYFDLLDALNKGADYSSIRVVPDKNGLFRVEEISRGFIKKTVALCNRYTLRINNPRPSYQYRYLKKLFSSLLDRVKEINKEIVQNPGKKDEFEILIDLYRSKIESAMGKISRTFEIHHLGNSIANMVWRDDLLGARSLCFDDEGFNRQLGITVRRVKMRVFRQVAPDFFSRSIALVKYSEIQEATELLKNPCDRSVDDLQEKLGTILHKERTPMGFMIDMMYRHRFLRWDIVNTLVTNYVGWKKGRVVSTDKVLRGLRGLNIDLVTDIDGELYSYSEMFGKEFRQERTVDGAFQRSPTPKILRRLVAVAREKQEAIARETGARAPVVISNSYSRLSLLRIRRGGVREKIAITGKVLASSKENIDAAESERGYKGRFFFTIREMFGFVQAKSHVNSSAIIVPESKLDKKSSQLLLLEALSNIVDENDVTMVIQRLAPSDIHHYVASADCEVLGRKEACEELKKKLQATETGTRRCEQLEQLISYFSSKPRAKATINIAGKRDSVSRRALFEHSEILAHNNRKIMIVKHEDDSIAIHTYIGATAVDNVSITAESGDKSELGDDQGSMGFGSEKKIAEEWLLDQTDSIRLSAESGAKRTIGDKDGSFDISGSTVVSIYFEDSVVPTESVSYFFSKASYIYQKYTVVSRCKIAFYMMLGSFFGMKKPRISYDHQRSGKERLVEVKGRIGDILLVPTVYSVVQEVRSLISDEDFEMLDVDALLRKFANIAQYEGTQKTPQKELGKRLQDILNKETTGDKDRKFLIGVKESLRIFREQFR